MPGTGKVAITACPLWTHLTPHYSVALLAAAARARGIEVVLPELEIRFYRHVDDASRASWQSIRGAFWDDDASVDGLFDRYRASFIDPAIDTLLADGVDVFAFSVNNRALRFTARTIDAIKARAPGAHVIVGGPTAFAAPDRLWMIPGVDAVCLGEGDLAFPDYLCHLREHGAPDTFPGFAVRRRDGSLDQGGPPDRIADLDALPFPDYSGHDLSLYAQPGTLATAVSRGCVQRCAYCAESPHFGRFRYRSGDDLFREVRHHIDGCGLEHVNLLFNDSLINGRVETLRRFAERVVESGTRVAFGGMAVARDNLTPELLETLHRAGCTDLSFGVESGSPEVLRLMNKKLQTPESAARALAAAKAAGIQTTVFMLVGFPGETEQHVHETIAFLCRNLDSIDRLMVNKLLLLPGSRLATEPERFDLDPTAALREFRTTDGTSTPEIRDARQRLLYMLFQEKMDLLAPIAVDGVDPVARVRRANAGLREEVRRLGAENAHLRQQGAALAQKCRMLLGLLSDASGGADGGARPAGMGDGEGRAAA